MERTHGRKSGCHTGKNIPVQKIASGNGACAVGCAREEEWRGVVVVCVRDEERREGRVRKMKNTDGHQCILDD